MEQQVRVTTTPEGAENTSNVYETVGGEAYVIEIPVVGAELDEIVIEVTVDTVIVTLGQEHAQIFEFPMEIDPDNVRTTLENGNLRIHVPKAIAARRRVIRLRKSA